MKKLIVATSSLKNAMLTSKKVVSKKSVLPILEYFKCHVTIKDGRATLTLTATDLETFCNVTINCEAKEEFTFLIHSEELKLIEKLDEQPITISVDEKAFIAQLTTDEETVSVTGDDFNDFPRIPNAERKHIGNFTSEFFSEIKTCLSYCSKDDLRPKFTGVNFEVTDSKVKLTATDAHLLRTTSIESELSNDAEGETFIMNPTFCKLISAVKNADEIRFAVMRKDDATFSVLNYSQGKYMLVELLSRTIADRFCDYASVIPAKHLTSVSIDKNDLSKRIDKAVLYANKTTMQGVFSINGKVILKTSDVDFAKEYKTEFAHLTKQGEDIDISFNLSLLKKVLNDVKGETVSIMMNKPNSAAVIKEGNSLTLIMPVLI